MAAATMLTTVTDGQETVLSLLLKNVPPDSIPFNAAPHSLHPFASTPTHDDPYAVLKRLQQTSATLARTLQAYSSFAARDHKLVSILRQSTALISGLHTAAHDTQRRVKMLTKRAELQASAVHGEPIPLDRSHVAEWCIERIEHMGRKSGMEAFKDGSVGDGKLIIVLGGKELVIDIDLIVRQQSLGLVAVPRVEVANVKTSHALVGHSENTIAERSTALDAFLHNALKAFIDEVQSDQEGNSMRAAFISRDFCAHLRYLMKLDDIAAAEGESGIRWFNDIGLMSIVADQLFKSEVDALLSPTQVASVDLDVFLSRAHALAVPYLLSPSMSFLVYLSPYAYYCLCQPSSSQSGVAHDADTYMKLDIPFSKLRSILSQRKTRPAGATTATLTLTSIPKSICPLSSQASALDPPIDFGERPFFRLPGTAHLSTLNHILLTRTSSVQIGHQDNLPSVPVEKPGSDTDEVWMLDFTDGGRSSGIIMTHSRMRQIQQVINPSAATSLDLGGGMNVDIGMNMPPLPGNWVGLLLHPNLPPSGRYIGIYTSPSNAHPPLRLRLTAPDEAGFKLERVPVRSLKEVYGILEVIRDQCWLNELLQTVKWSPEDVMPDSEAESEVKLGQDEDPETELQALLEGSIKPRRINVNMFLPLHPPSLGPDDVSPPNEFDDIEQAVPGLSSLSNPLSSASASAPNIPEPCVALGFFVNESKGQRQAMLVLRHDTRRRKGIRVDVQVTSSPSSQDDDDGLFGASTPSPVPERPNKEMIEQLEETARRGGYFGVVGKVWNWVSSGSKIHRE